MRAATGANPGVLTAALGRLEAFLLEPAEPQSEAPIPISPRPCLVVAVFGLARHCGATTVARALGAELAARGETGAAAVCTALPAGGIPLASAAAGRLAAALADVPGARTRAVGRLCLIEGAEALAVADAARALAPLVLDAGSASIGGAAAAVADRVLLVATPPVEPALVGAASACLARVGCQPVPVLNRAAGDPRWSGRAAVELPEARLGAQLALSGREPRGALGRAVAELADLCQESQ